ncbi:MAG: histidine phosphatase family protein, partial [Bacteroidota bacterium]
MNKTLYIIRHGQTDYNLKRIIQGSGIDSSLNNKGRDQALKFYQKYSTIDFELVITSALQRTHQTVAPFIDNEIPWIKMPEINEINWGIHEGKEGSQSMIEHYSEITKAWSSGIYDVGIEEGETAAQLRDSTKVFIQT